MKARKRKKDKKREKKKEEKKEKRAQWAPKIHMRTVKRNRNEIEAQKKQILSTQPRK